MKFFDRLKRKEETAAQAVVTEFHALINEAAGADDLDDAKAERLASLAASRGIPLDQLARDIPLVAEYRKLTPAAKALEAKRREQEAANRAVVNHNAETARLVRELNDRRDAERVKLEDGRAAAMRATFAEMLKVRRMREIAGAVPYHLPDADTLPPVDEPVHLAIPNPDDTEEIAAARLEYWSSQWLVSNHLDPDGTAKTRKGEAAIVIQRAESERQARKTQARLVHNEDGSVTDPRTGNTSSTVTYVGNDPVLSGAGR